MVLLQRTVLLEHPANVLLRTVLLQQSCAKESSTDATSTAEAEPCPAKSLRNHTKI